MLPHFAAEGLRFDLRVVMIHKIPRRPIRGVASASGRHFRRAGLHALVDQMLGVDFTPAFQRKGRASALSQQPFQTAALVRLDAHLSIDREAAAVFPRGHLLCVVRRRVRSGWQRNRD